MQAPKVEGPLAVRWWAVRLVREQSASAMQALAQ
jgi:hypothetical protein